jgi:O-antigen/teichoic acid export membrane protein
MFEPRIVGIYYMAQQVASLPQKLKTSFDPILGPVITQSLANGDMGAIARQVRQVAFWIMAAQGCLALMGSIPGEGVMGVVGPQFVSAPPRWPSCCSPRCWPRPARCADRRWSIPRGIAT